MKKRLITGIILLAVFIPLIFIDSTITSVLFYLLMGFLACLGAYEVMHLNFKERKYSWKIYFTTIFSTALIYLAGLGTWSNIVVKGLTFIQQENPNLEVSSINELISLISSGKLDFSDISIALILLSVLIQLATLVFSKEFDAKDLGMSLIASIYVGFGMASVVALRGLGARFIIYMFIITCLTDVFAYAYGMLFGKHPLTEISPKKSVEGSFSGTIVATVVGTLFAYLYGYLFNSSGELHTIFDIFTDFETNSEIKKIIIIALTTLSASIMSQIGDLVASKIKRTFEVKDYGKIFPGHGGAIDRFDSVMFTSMFLLSAFLIIGFVLVL